jgi:beta-alanine degradation protein BauB
MAKDELFSGPHWTDALREELAGAATNGQVGSRIVSETDRVRVWLLDLAPGERLPFHTHVNDYFWTTTAAGRARSRYGDGRVVDRDYAVGETQHHSYGPGESMTHDLENIGDTVLSYTTVEFLGGPNRSLI